MLRNVQSSQKYKDTETVKTDPILVALKTATPAQIENWINNNVNSLAEAKQVLKMLVKVLFYLR